MTHDSVHLHIRAHMPMQTATLFVRGEALEWGGYPDGITLLDFSNGTDLETAYLSMLDWFEDRIE